MNACGVRMEKRLFVCLVLYKILYELVYVIVIGPYFPDANYVIEINIFKIVVSWIVYAFFVLSAKRLLSSDKFSDLLLFLLDMGYAVPALTLYGFGGMIHLNFLYFISYWTLLHLSVYLLGKFKFDILNPKLSKIFMVVLILFLICLGGYVSYKTNGLSLDISLTDVYGRRAEMMQKSISSLDSYIINMLGSAIPVCVALMLEKKKYLFAVSLSVVQGALYSIGAMKKFLFFLIVVWGFFFLIKSIKVKKMIVPLLNLSCILAIIDYYVTDGMPQVANYIHRRTFMLPVSISTYYFDFFTKNKPDYLKQSFLRHFGFISDYEIPIPNVIGGNYEGSFDSVMSNGLCGDALANFGWYSLLFYPFLVALVMVVYNKLLYTHSFCVCLSVAAVLFIYLTNGSITSNLLTNGFILIWIILYVDYCTTFWKGRLENAESG